MRVLAGIGAALLALTLGGLALHLPGADSVGSIARTNLFVALLAVAGAVYLGAVALVLRAPPTGGAWLVLGVALALRAVVLLPAPFLSSDLYRYIWDGRVQVAGINPYRAIPADPLLESLRDGAIYPHVNRREYAPTIYPPMAQVIFQAVARVSQTPLAIKLTMVGFELVAMAAMLRLLALARLPPARLLIYAWNPLAVWTFAGNGHVDALAIGFIALALLARGFRRQGLAGAALGAAVLVKFLPVVVAPALWKRWDWRFPAAALALAIVLYAGYASVGWRVFGFLPGYAAEEGLAPGTVGGGGFWLLAGLAEFGRLPEFAGPAYLALAAALLLGLGAWIAFRDRVPCDPAADAVRVAGRTALLAAALMLAISPHYPWYFPWLALPCCLAPLGAAIWLGVAPLLLYLDPLHERFLWPALVYVPAIGLAARDLLRGPARIGIEPRGPILALTARAPGESAHQIER